MDSLRQVDTEPLIPLEVTISKTFKKMHGQQCRKAKEAREWGKGGQRFFFFFLNELKIKRNLKKREKNQIKRRQQEASITPSNPSESHFGWRDRRLVSGAKKEGK